MVQRVEAYGSILEFPDGMSDADMAKAITSNEHHLNPQASLVTKATGGISDAVSSLVKPAPSVADLAAAQTPSQETSNLVTGVPFRKDYADKVVQQTAPAAPSLTPTEAPETAEQRLQFAAARDAQGQGDKAVAAEATSFSDANGRLMREKEAVAAEAEANRRAALRIQATGDNPDPEAVRLWNEEQGKAARTNAQKNYANLNPTLNDTAIDFRSGVAKVPGAVTGLMDIVTGLAVGDRPTDRISDEIGKKIGFQPAEYARKLEDQYSGIRKQGQKDITAVWDDETKSWWDVAGAYASNPGVTAGNIIQSIPSMGAGGLAARSLALTKAGLTPIAAGAVGEGAVMAGMQMDGMDRSVDARKAALASLATGIMGAAVGRYSGALASKMGIRDVDTVLAGGVAGGATMPFYKRIPAAMVQEGLIEEGSQSSMEQMLKNIAEDKPVMEGVARSAVEGTLAGAGMGAAFSAPGWYTKPSPSATPLTQKAAELSAKQKTQATGQEHVVVPHPSADGKYTAVQSVPAPAQQSAPEAISADDILGDVPLTPKQQALAEIDQIIQSGKDRAAAILMPRPMTPPAATTTAEAAPIQGAQVGTLPTPTPSGLDTGSIQDSVSTRSDNAGIPRNDGRSAGAAAGLAGSTNTNDGQTVPAQSGTANAVAPSVDTHPSNGTILVKGFTKAQVSAARDSLNIKQAKIGENGNAVFPKGTDIKAVKAALGVAESQSPKAAKKTKPVIASSDLLQRIKQLGGINSKYASDITGEPRGVGGWKFAFNKNGLGLDDLATQLHAEGFNIDMNDDTDNGGVNQLAEMIRQHIAGERAFKHSSLEAKAKAEASTNDAKHAYAYKLGINTRGLSEQELDDAIYMAEDAIEMAKLDAASNPELAAEVSDDIIDEVPFGDSVKTDSAALSAWLGEEDGQTGTERKATEAVASGSEAGTGSDGGTTQQARASEGQAGRDEQPILESYTNAEVLKREDAKAKAEEEASKEAPAKNVNADQTDLFNTQDSLFNSNREVEKTTPSGMSGEQSELDSIQPTLGAAPNSSGNDNVAQPSAESKPTAEQKIRAEFSALEGVQLGKAYPITVEHNRVKRQFLAEQRKLSSGKTPAVIHLSTIKSGKLLASDDAGAVVNKFKLTGANELVDEGFPHYADGAELKQWTDAGFEIPAENPSEQQSTAILDRANVTGKDRLDIMRDFRDGKHSLEDLEKAYPASVDAIDTSAKPIEETHENRQSKVEPEESRQIADFGEKLGGARKDLSAAIKHEYSDSDIASLPLSKIWPADLAEKIEDKFVAAFAFAARQEIPAKPRVKYKVDSWVKKVKILRDIAGMMTDSETTRVKAEALLKETKALDGFNAKISLLESIDREQWKRIGKVWEYPNAYSYDESGKQVPASSVLVEIDDKRVRFDGAKSVGEVIDKVNEKLGVAAQGKRMEFEVRGRSGAYFINKKGDSLYRKLKTFTDSKEAIDFKRNNYDELVAAWESVKDSDNVKEADLRTRENRERTAEDWRKGKDVTPEQFISEFGFRGVEFGNWVKQGKNAKERQGMLNAAYDALMDLSSIINVPPKALSLDGSLGLGFGSRGSGAASAHFEPDTLVINLTKTRGAGTLAHEWFHALDNYFQLKRGKPATWQREEGYITYNPENYYAHQRTGMKLPARDYNAAIDHTVAANPSGTDAEKRAARARRMVGDPTQWVKKEGVRPEVGEAFADLVKSLNESPMAKRASLIDKGKSGGYWSRIIERGARSFENYVIHKMMLKGYHNDYLANVTPASEFQRDGGRYPYLLEGEIEPVAEAFDNLFATVKTKETENGVALFSLTPRMDVDNIGVDFYVARDVISRVIAAKKVWNVDILPFSTFDDLPIAVQQYANQYGEKDARNAKGIAHSGKVYVIAENNESESDVEQTILHEVEGHIGIHRMYGGEINQKLNALYLAIGGRDGLTKLANERGIAEDLTRYASMLGKSEFTNEVRTRIMMDEALAHYAQHPKFGDRVKAIIGMIRAWLREHGFAKLAEYGETDLLNILRKGRKHLKQSGDGANATSLMVAWHGSPHDHDGFDMSKVGTGEGAQAYGYGMYFAGNKEVAEYYRKNLSAPNAYSVDSALKAASKSFKEAGYSRKDALAGMKDAYQNHSIKDIEMAVDLQYGGRLYKVDLAPSEDEYLLWDKPLSEQSLTVRKAMRPFIEEYGLPTSEKGSSLYSVVKELEGKKQGLGSGSSPSAYNAMAEAASKALHDAGVRGIKYLDGSSRNRPIKEIKQAFLSELPEDAGFAEVMELVGTGKFSAEQDAVLRALESDDWLGYDYPAQAISAALGNSLAGHDASPALKNAVDELSKDGTFNYVIFDDKDVSITAKFSRNQSVRGLSITSVESIANPIAEKLKNVRTVKVVARQSYIPGLKDQIDAAYSRFQKDRSSENLDKYLAVAKDNIEGAYVNGDLYLVASNLGSEARVQEVLRHEVAHLSVEQMLNEVDPKLYDRLLSNVMLMDKTGNKYIRELAAAVDKTQPGLDKKTRAAEIIAQIAERGDHEKDTPNTIRTLWQRIMDGIKAFYKLVFGDTLNDQDVRDIVAQSFRWARGESDAVRVYGGSENSNMQASRGTQSPESFARMVIQEFSAENEKAFSIPTTTSNTIRGAIEDVVKGAEYKGEVTQADETEQSGADHVYLFRSKSGDEFRVSETDDGKVWIDVSQFLKGSGGQDVYSAVADYAFNTGKKFIGDPYGLTMDSIIRRTVNMLTSAIKHGTTKHLEAARQQEWGKPEEGVVPLDWTGSDIDKTEALIHTFLATMQNLAPEIKEYRYDFNTEQFIDRDGNAVTGADIEYRLEQGRRLRGHAKPRVRAGEKTARRAVFLQSLVSEARKGNGERNAILERVLRWGDSSRPENTSRLFSRRAASDDDTGDSSSGRGQKPLDLQGGQSGFKIPSETSAQEITRKHQDKLNRIKVIQDAIREQGGSVTVKHDVYQAMERMTGRVAAQQESFTDNVVDPLMKRVADSKFNLEDLGTYLMALGAKDRNAYIKTLRDDMPDNGSGISNTEADQIIADFKANQQNFSEFDSLARDIQSLTERKLNLLTKGNVMTQEQADAMRKAMGFYVPYKGHEIIDDVGNKVGNGVGGGYSTSKRVSKQAMGRISKAGQVVENIIRDYHASIILVEKAHVGAYLHNLVKDNPDPTLWTIEQPEKMPLIGANGQVQYRDMGYDNTKEVRFIREGREVRIQLHDPIMAAAYNNLNSEQISSMLAVASNINMFLRQMYTQKNPEFIVTNFMRDAQTAFAVLTGEGGAGFAAKAMGNVPGAAKAMFAHDRHGEAGNDWDAYYEVARRNGALTAFAMLDDLETQALKLDATIAKHGGSSVVDAWKRGLSHRGTILDRAGKAVSYASKTVLYRALDSNVMMLIENLNHAAENAYRMAAFRAYIDNHGGLNGATPKVLSEASRIAKNVTVNFNRKGEQSPAWNAAYLFWNANVQGTQNLFRAATQTEHKAQVKALLAGLFMLGMFMAMSTDDDDDSLTSEYDKEHNLNLHFGAKVVKIVLAYGLGFFFGAGYSVGSVMKGRMKPMKAAMTIVGQALDHFTPIGSPIQGGEISTNMVAVTVAPTMLSPLVMSATNTNAFGGKVVPHYSEDDGKLDRETMYRGTRGSAYDQVANSKALAWADVSPETLKMVTGFLTGGTGTFASNLLQTGKEAATGQEIDIKHAPFVRKVLTSIDVENYRSRFYSQIEDVKKIAGETGEKQARILGGASVLYWTKEMKRLRTEEGAARDKGDHAKIVEVENKQIKLATRLNDSYKRAMVKLDSKTAR